MHTQTRLHHSSVALSMMRSSQPYQPYHNVGPCRAPYELFWGRPAAGFLHKCCSLLGSDLDVGHRLDEVNEYVSQFRRLKYWTLTPRLYTLTESSFDRNAHSETFTPLLCCVIDDASLTAMPAMS